jgi:tRNA(Ile)-lysidine synthase
MSLQQEECDSVLELRFFAKLTSLLKNQSADRLSNGISLAYSGGLDSSVLLIMLHKYCNKYKIPFFAFHVNHSLSLNATNWENHCRARCTDLNIQFSSKQVSVKRNGLGLESAARSLRYQALGQMCAEHGIKFVLTAHHVDDQAETILMQLLRGTGLRGLSGMDEFNYAPGLLNAEDILLVRPLLLESKETLLQFARAHQLPHIEDESNTEVHFKRNAVRHLIMPIIEQVAPNFTQRITKTAHHVRAANHLLDGLAKVDLDFCRANEGLSLDRLEGMNSEKIDNVLRYWIFSLGIQLPSSSKLGEMRTQIFNASDDAMVSIHHENFTLHRYSRNIFIVKKSENNKEDHADLLEFSWAGEKTKHFPHLKGRLEFIQGTNGICSNQLLNSRIVLKPRSGGERLRLAENRPSRSLKSHFQTLKVPFWLRSEVPILYIENKLFFVGLVGMDAAFISETQVENINLEWIPD